MELRQLRYFMEVAKREHVSEAAEYLHVAQSAISRQIANLESELGVSLFKREGRNVKLTAIGKVFLEHTDTAMKAIDYAKEQIDEYLIPKEERLKSDFQQALLVIFFLLLYQPLKKNTQMLLFILDKVRTNF